MFHLINRYIVSLSLITAVLQLRSWMPVKPFSFLVEMRTMRGCTVALLGHSVTLPNREKLWTSWVRHMMLSSVVTRTDYGERSVLQTSTPTTTLPRNTEFYKCVENFHRINYLQMFPRRPIFKVGGNLFHFSDSFLFVHIPVTCF